MSGGGGIGSLPGGLCWTHLRLARPLAHVAALKHTIELVATILRDNRGRESVWCQHTIAHLSRRRRRRHRDCQRRTLGLARGRTCWCSRRYHLRLCHRRRGSRGACLVHFRGLGWRKKLGIMYYISDRYVKARRCRRLCGSVEQRSRGVLVLAVHLRSW